MSQDVAVIQVTNVAIVTFSRTGQWGPYSDQSWLAIYSNADLFDKKISILKIFKMYI